MGKHGLKGCINGGNLGKELEWSKTRNGVWYGEVENSIAFGSAPRREVDSQPISSLASSQSDRNTQFGFFVSGKRGPKEWADHLPTHPSSGRMVMQMIGIFLVGGLNPSRVHTPPPPPPTVSRPGFEPPTKKFASAPLPFDRRLFDSDKLPHCLEPWMSNPL